MRNSWYHVVCTESRAKDGGEKNVRKQLLRQQKSWYNREVTLRFPEYLDRSYSLNEPTEVSITKTIEAFNTPHFINHVNASEKNGSSQILFTPFRRIELPRLFGGFPSRGRSDVKNSTKLRGPIEQHQSQCWNMVRRNLKERPNSEMHLYLTYLSANWFVDMSDQVLSDVCCMRADDPDWCFPYILHKAARGIDNQELSDSEKHVYGNDGTLYGFNDLMVTKPSKSTAKSRLSLGYIDCCFPDLPKMLDLPMKSRPKWMIDAVSRDIDAWKQYYNKGKKLHEDRIVFLRRPSVGMVRGFESNLCEFSLQFTGKKVLTRNCRTVAGNGEYQFGKFLTLLAIIARNMPKLESRRNTSNQEEVTARFYYETVEESSDLVTMFEPSDQSLKELPTVSWTRNLMPGSAALTSTLSLPLCNAWGVWFQGNLYKARLSDYVPWEFKETRFFYRGTVTARTGIMGYPNWSRLYDNAATNSNITLAAADGDATIVTDLMEGRKRCTQETIYNRHRSYNTYFGPLFRMHDRDVWKTVKSSVVQEGDWTPGKTWKLVKELNKKACSEEPTDLTSSVRHASGSTFTYTSTDTLDVIKKNLERVDALNTSDQQFSNPRIILAFLALRALKGKSNAGVASSFIRNLYCQMSPRLDQNVEKCHIDEAPTNVNRTRIGDAMNQIFPGIQDLLDENNNLRNVLSDIRISGGNNIFSENDLDLIQIGRKNTPLYISKIEDQVRYKYSFDDNVSVRLIWGFLAGQLMFRAEFLYDSFVDKVFVPYEHYIPVRADMKDFLDKLHFVHQNDAWAQKIAERGRARALEVYQPENIYLYVHTLLFALAQLQSDMQM